jgi:hypothetical protein
MAGRSPRDQAIMRIAKDYRMRFGCLLCVILLLGDFAQAEDTNITVRVVAKNAQYVGDLVDGAFVTITDAESGEMLAQGTTAGAPGNPKRIMATPRKRGQGMSGDGDAKFTATLDIDEPRYLRVTAYGPMDKRFSANQASATQWLIPGKHITGGDGWVIELQGLLVAPNLASSTVPLATARSGLDIEAEVMLMCGCPIQPGFHWDPADYEVVAVLRRGDTQTGSFPLAYAGAASEFAAKISADLPGVYDISVYAYDAATGNSGVGQIELTVTGE